MKSLPPNRPQEHFDPKNITPQKNRQKEKALIYQGFSCVFYRLRSWIRAALPRKLRMVYRTFKKIQEVCFCCYYSIFEGFTSRIKNN